MVRCRIDNIKAERFEICSEYNPEVTYTCTPHFYFHSKEDGSMIIVRAEYKVEHEDNTFIKFAISCFFELHPDSRAEITTPDGIKLHRDFASFLVSESLGIARGYMYARTERISPNLVALPLIVTGQFIPEEGLLLKNV